MSFKRSLLITTTILSMACSTVFAADEVAAAAELSTTHGETLHRNKEFQVWPPEASAATDSKVAFIGSRIGRFRADAFQRQDHLTQLSLVETTIANMESLAGIGKGCSNLATLNLRGIKHEDSTPLALAILLGQYAHGDLLRRLTAGDTTLKFTAASDASDDIRTKDESGKRASAGTQAFIYKDSYIQQLARDILTLRAHQEQTAQAAALATPTETRSDEEVAWDELQTKHEDSADKSIVDVTGSYSLSGHNGSMVGVRLKNANVVLDEAFLSGASTMQQLHLTGAHIKELGTTFGASWDSLTLLVISPANSVAKAEDIIAAAARPLRDRIVSSELKVVMSEESLHTSPRFESTDPLTKVRDMAKSANAAEDRLMGRRSNAGATTGAASPSASVAHLADKAPASRGWFGGIFGSSSSDATATTPPAAPAAPPAANPTATEPATEDGK